MKGLANVAAVGTLTAGGTRSTALAGLGDSATRARLRRSERAGRYSNRPSRSTILLEREIVPRL